MDKFEKLISDYKQHKTEKPHSEEFYKYEAIQHFQNNWNIDAPDFAVMLGIALKKQTNLLFYGSLSTIQKVASRFPEQTQQQFQNLFDEGKELLPRMNDFQRTMDSLMKQIDPKRSGMQDERAMGVYLTFRFPDKYYFFKDSFYSKFVELFNEKKATKGLKYAHYIWLCDEFKEKYVLRDKELWQITNATLPPNAWPDTSRNVLTQDILFCGLDQYQTVNYWLFQCNLQQYDLINEWKNIESETWRVTAHKSLMQKGDKVILWVVGKESGCYGLCTITSEVQSDDSGYWVEMDIDYNLTETPILKTLLDTTEPFKGKRNSQGTNFKATKEQFDIIQTFISLDEDERKLIQFVLEIGDRESVGFHFKMIDDFISHFELKEDDQRLVFSAPDSRDGLSVTVNQRYIYKTTKESYRISLPANELERIKRLPAYISHEYFKEHSGQDSLEVYIYLKKDRQIIETYKNQWFKTCKANLDYGLSSGFIKYDNPAYRKAVFDKEYREKILSFLSKSFNENDNTIEMKENINYPKNLILYGPPGTGKTFHTIGQAMKIAAPNIYEQHKNETDRNKLIEEFNRLRKNKQIEFVTFHQSFGYEEFVEGIKPIPVGETGNEDGEEMIYQVSDGIFKRICGEAEIGELQGNSVKSQISPESRVFKVSLKGERNKATKQQCFEKNEIRIGWEKTGSLEELFELKEENEYYQNLGKNDKNSLSYFYNMEEGDIALIFKDTKTIDAIGVITGEYIFDKTLSEYNHVRKVKWLLKGKDISIYEMNGNTNLTLPTVYQLSRISPAMVSKLVQENSGELKVIKEKESKNYVLIIDEINRGNISKIFGELITLIEPDKRQGETNALEVTLPYSKTKFSVPSNLYIIGTMNTADRSIALIDTALRRRFEFKEMMPNPTILSNNIEGINLQKLLETINERITFLLDRDHAIGHAYFMGIVTKNDLCNIFRNQVIPLLQEYFYTDWRKIQLVLGDNNEWGKALEEKLVQVMKHYTGAEEKKLFGVDLDDYEEQEIYELNPLIANDQFDDFPSEGFVHIYEKPAKG